MASWHKSRCRRRISRSRPAPVQEYRSKSQLFLAMHCNYDFATTLGSSRMNSTPCYLASFLFSNVVVFAIIDPNLRPAHAHLFGLPKVPIHEVVESDESVVILLSA